MTMRHLAGLVVLASLLAVRPHAWADGVGQAPVEQTHLDSALGYRISYPRTLHFTSDAALLRRVMQAGLEALAVSDEVREAARSAGTQFVISLYPFRSEPGGPLNPNLELSTISVAGTDLDSAGYAAQVASQLATAMPQARIMEPPTPMQIGGRTFYRMTVSLSLHGIHVRNRQYVYVSRQKELAYALAFTDSEDGFAAHLPTFEAIVNSMRFTFSDGPTRPRPPAPAPDGEPPGSHLQDGDPGVDSRKAADETALPTGLQTGDCAQDPRMVLPQSMR